MADRRSSDAILIVGNMYERVVNALRICTRLHVPLRRQSFYKFWWSQELDILKDNYIRSRKIWLTAGKPHCRLIADRRRKDKLVY